MIHKLILTFRAFVNIFFQFIDRRVLIIIDKLHYN